jgi:hypothetical protein
MWKRVIQEPGRSCRLHLRQIPQMVEMRNKNESWPAAMVMSWKEMGNAMVQKNNLNGGISLPIIREERRDCKKS